jgi:hypothetical protein
MLTEGTIDDRALPASAFALAALWSNLITLASSATTFKTAKQSTFRTRKHWYRNVSTTYHPVLDRPAPRWRELVGLDTPGCMALARMLVALSPLWSSARILRDGEMEAASRSTYPPQGDGRKYYHMK